MQGPGNPGRGQNPENQTGQDRELKDWQKATWYGPAPSSLYPFEEPEDAPELEELRSDNLSDRENKFWKDPGYTGYQPKVNEKKKAKVTRRGETDQKRTERRISLRLVVALVLMIITAAVVLDLVVFRVRTIEVTGNRFISREDIIRFSGIRYGDSILRLNENDIAKRMSASAVSAAISEGNYNYNCLDFRYLEKEMPGKITIAVRERESCCWLTYCGILYVMDKNGMVLYESEDPQLRPDLAEVKGLDIRSGARVGQKMIFSSTVQQNVFSELFLEIKVLGCTGRISEADLSNTASLLLTTREGFTVALGNKEALHAKLRSMLLVQDKLLEMGYTGGAINVSNPETPFFSPPVS